jgi:hypothetical protein
VQMDRNETVWEVVDWIDRWDKKRAGIKALMNPRVSQNVLTS